MVVVVFVSDLVIVVDICVAVRVAASEMLDAVAAACYVNSISDTFFMDESVLTEQIIKQITKAEICFILLKERFACFKWRLFFFLIS